MELPTWVWIGVVLIVLAVPLLLIFWPATPAAVKEARELECIERTGVIRTVVSDPERGLLLGRVAVVLQPVSRKSGLVAIDGELFLARPVSPMRPVPRGERVHVSAFSGATLLVARRASMLL